MAGYRTHAEPSVIRRASEMWPEGVEQIPYAQTFVAPYPFPETAQINGGGGGGTSITDGSASLVPKEFDITFIRGDAVTLDFLFQGVCWTQDEPAGVLPVPWVQHFWMAEIRDPDNWPADPCWYYNGWIPAWGGLYPNCYANWFVMTKKAEFACSSEFVEGLLVTEGPTFGTVVTIHLDSDETVMYAKEYLWDLQSAETFTWEIDPETSEPDPDTYVFGGVHTWRQGTVTVLPDYTIKPTKVVPTSP